MEGMDKMMTMTMVDMVGEEVVIEAEGLEVHRSGEGKARSRPSLWCSASITNRESVGKAMNVLSCITTERKGYGRNEGHGQGRVRYFAM